MPELVAIGRPIDAANAASTIDAIDRPVSRGTLDLVAPLGLIAEHATGYSGRPGLIGARPDGSGWSPRFRLERVEQVDPAQARFELVDDVAELALSIHVAVAETVTIAAELRNEGDTPYWVERLSPSISLGFAADELITFSGRWCREFQPDRADFEGTAIVENRTGRTSHARLPACFVGDRGFDETSGEVVGVQLAWSGNFELAAERLADGRRHVQIGELLAPGEVELAPGQSYRSPDVVVAWSEHGIGPASDAFHATVRRDLAVDGPRPVLLNTWEAVYFDHRLDVLQQLADVAAEVGVERFVLDDGWFGGRRDDTKGLGDWWVSDAVWPGGLGPIVDHVTGLGMEFGLWVEPEMVNPDSELYRKHPEWTLTTDGYEPVLGRHQLVLDLGRDEVRDFLFEAIDALLSEYSIGYLKWDMNRDVVQGSRAGRAAVHGHVVGVYELLDRLRAAHPSVEIESCASGGGRADLGILRRTQRIWTSDCNDALERQLIQRGFSMLFPPEVMGAHIGPERAHTTGRRQDLGFRGATALFGHLGIEWNVLQTSSSEREHLASIVACHQRLRPLLHEGRVVRVDHSDPAAIVHGVVAQDRSRAVFSYAQMTPSATVLPSRFTVPGLDPDRRYRVAPIPDVDSAVDFGRSAPAWLDHGIDLTGRQLERVGLQPPILHPESALLVEIAQIEEGV